MTEQLALTPFRAIFGSGSGMMQRPEFSPNMTSKELLEEYEANRQAQADVHRLDRDGIDTVVKYAGASAAARSTLDLSAIRSDARMTLLTMDELELASLAKAGPGKVRKWIEGGDHGIFGVPVVGSISAPQAKPVLSPEEKWKIRALMLKSNGASSELQLAL
ncbi:hypothetical protein [Rhizobium sp. 42MFCr.1]|uniref:hypothetical protein n=1 Tax=Rhizobium sp. 42MFCr.1 TaxID=1048680 RepID=UPI0018DE114E|nr:hypothetical protein [Rhizobium sp. 42MFCr.1]